MKRFREFRCADGHVHEELVEDNQYMNYCPHCTKANSPAHRIVSAGRCQLDHTFPGEGDKWARRHEAGARVQTS